jgi:type 1 glutamine amidotransferase
MKKFSFHLVILLASTLIYPLQAEDKKIVLLSGKDSHGAKAHNWGEGVDLLAKALNEESGLPVKAVTHKGGWPKDWSIFDNAATVVILCDGGGGHIVNSHLERFGKIMDKGVGLVCVHYGVEVPKGDPGDAFVDWIGGYFETHWSVNPHWKAEFKTLPEHPITQGVKPFTWNDEWYYHMRFRKDMKGVTPILSAHPPASTAQRGDGPHSNNRHVREAIKNGEIQHVAWASERPNGGRGFGITGAHYHAGWDHDDFRTVVLNAIVWTANIKVPEEGVKSLPNPTKRLNADGQ